jgi:hypothetical protein
MVDFPEMEPIKHTKTARLRGLRMYRPDLEQLVELFQKTCESVVISDNVNRYGSLEEMKEHAGARIKDLDIRGERPGVHFLLNQKEFAPGSTTPAIFNELRTEEITDEAEMLFLKVGSFLRSYERPTSTRFLIPAIAGMIGACIFVALKIPPMFQGQRFQVNAGIVICILFSIVFVCFGIVNSQNCLLLETKLNSPSFFARNREDFAKQGIIAAIGGLVGWLLGHFLR